MSYQISEPKIKVNEKMRKKREELETASEKRKPIIEKELRQLESQKLDMILKH